MAVYTPPAAFSFRAEFDLGDATARDMAFTEMSGLTAELEVETVKEGGENRFEHRLPGRARYPDLVLRRGLLVDSGLRDWIVDAVQNLAIVPVTVWISLLDAEANPLRVWTVLGCWPRKWVVGDFNAQDSAIAVETLELVYSRFTVE